MAPPLSRREFLRLTGMGLMATVLGACGGQDVTQTRPPAATRKAGGTEAASATPTATNTEAASATPTATNTEAASATPTATNTEAASATPDVSPTPDETQVWNGYEQMYNTENVRFSPEFSAIDVGLLNRKVNSVRLSDKLMQNARQVFPKINYPRGTANNYSEYTMFCLMRAQAILMAASGNTSQYDVLLGNGNELSGGVWEFQTFAGISQYVREQQVNQGGGIQINISSKIEQPRPVQAEMHGTVACVDTLIVADTPELDELDVSLRKSGYDFVGSYADDGMSDSRNIFKTRFFYDPSDGRLVIVSIAVRSLSYPSGGWDQVSFSDYGSIRRTPDERVKDLLLATARAAEMPTRFASSDAWRGYTEKGVYVYRPGVFTEMIGDSNCSLGREPANCNHAIFEQPAP